MAFIRHVRRRAVAVARLTFVGWMTGFAYAATLDAQTVTATSYERARAVVQRGVEALGTAGPRAPVEWVHFRSHASITEIGQSASPSAAYDQRPLDADVFLDLAHKRYSQRQLTQFRGSGPRGTSVTTTERTGFAVDLRANAVYPMDETGVLNTNTALLRTFPHLLLQSALRRPATLRSLGEAVWLGRRHDVVDFVDADGTRLTIFFDKRTGLPSKTETLSDAFLDGLGASERAFSDYRAVDGIQVPFAATVVRAGVTTSKVVFSMIKFNERPDDVLFERPTGAVVGPTIGSGRTALTTTVIGRDAYYVNAIETGTIFFYSSMFVVFDDFVLVVEAPLSTTIARAVIAKIHEMAPGKPVRYVVPTHYHVDHTGGIGGYIAEGATIVTTPGNRQFFEQVAKLKHPFTGDNALLPAGSPAIETFSGKRVIADAHHVVELLSLGPTAHVDEMVIAYMPAEKIAFISDLFLVSTTGANGAAEPSTVSFLETIDRLKLNIETIAGGHGRVGTMEELRAAVAESKSVSAPHPPRTPATPQADTQAQHKSPQASRTSPPAPSPFSESTSSRA